MVDATIAVGAWVFLDVLRRSLCDTLGSWAGIRDRLRERGRGCGCAQGLDRFGSVVATGRRLCRCASGGGLVFSSLWPRSRTDILSLAPLSCFAGELRSHSLRLQRSTARSRRAPSSETITISPPVNFTGALAHQVLPNPLALATGWAGGATCCTFSGVSPPAGGSDHLPRAVGWGLKHHYLSFLLWPPEGRRWVFEVIASHQGVVSSRAWWPRPALVACRAGRSEGLVSLPAHWARPLPGLGHRWRSARSPPPVMSSTQARSSAMNK
jgi:hypothetical protein